MSTWGPGVGSRVLLPREGSSHPVLIALAVGAPTGRGYPQLSVRSSKTQAGEINFNVI